MIPYLEHHLVDHCNLNCNGCSHFSPLCEPWFEELGDFERDFRKLAEISDQKVGIIRLMGGEPLLHPNINQFLMVCRELFPLTHIELVTNGLLLKKRKAEIVDTCNNYGITVCISHYGLIDYNEALAGFKYPRCYTKENNMYNLCFDVTGSQDNVDSYNKCDMHHYSWYYFQGGKFYPCCVLGNIHFFNEYFKDQLPNPIYTNEDDMSISVYNHTIEEIEEFLKTPRDVCKFCNVNIRHTTEHPFAVSNKDIHEWIHEV